MPPKPTKKAARWYDKHRKCEDGSCHEGDLELITWNGTNDDGDRLGWGAVFLAEADDLERIFETKYGADPEKFYDYWPQGFRWTCCGLSGDMKMGCDHHGAGSTPCHCDFCVMGKPLPEGMCPPTSQSRKGLKLRRGPDPRSFDPARAAISEMMRGLFGMDLGSSASDATGGSRTAGSSAGGSSSGRGSNAGGSRAGGSAGASSNSSSGGGGAAGSKGKGQAVGATASAVPARAAQPGSSNSIGTAAAAAGGGALAAATVAKVCEVCGKLERPGGGSLLKCGGCRAVRYCSTECQAAHWPVHKAPCKEERRRQKQQQQEQQQQQQDAS